jgi:hypothetical protein
MKRIISIALALLAAWIVMKILWWVFTAAFTIAMNLFMLVVMAVIALPIYVMISRRLS